MAESPFDPIMAWQKFVADWEKQINVVQARVAGTEEFSRALNQATKMQIATQQQFDKQMEQFLKTVHLPSKTDIGEIHERLSAIEESIERVSMILKSKDGASKQSIPRTRRPKSTTS